MVQNGTETTFFPGPPTSKPVRGMALAPYCPWPLCIRTAICRLPGMGRNGTNWNGNSIFPRPANQQASPGHGHGALLPLASLHPHCNLPTLRNGTKWYRMVRKLNFSPPAKREDRKLAWPWRPIAHGLSVPAPQSAGSSEWDEMVQNGTETHFFPAAPTSKPVRGMAFAPYCPWPLCIRTAFCQRSGMGRNGTEWYRNHIFPRPPNGRTGRGMAKEYQVRQVLKAIDKLQAING